MASKHGLTLNNGVSLPAWASGCFRAPPRRRRRPSRRPSRRIRLIDTAAAYLNEREVGEGLRRSSIARDDVFIETKV